MISFHSTTKFGIKLVKFLRFSIYWRCHSTFRLCANSFVLYSRCTFNRNSIYGRHA